MPLDLILSITCIFLLFCIYFLREGHKTLENQIKSFAGFVDGKLEVIEQNFASYTDFANEKLSELEAEQARIKYFEEIMYSWTENTEKLITLQNYQFDCLRHDYYRHIYGFRHLDPDGSPVIPEPIIEREFNLNQLKDSIEERSRAYGIPMATQYYRHREEKPE